MGMPNSLAAQLPMALSEISIFRRDIAPVKSWPFLQSWSRPPDPEPLLDDRLPGVWVNRVARLEPYS